MSAFIIIYFSLLILVHGEASNLANSSLEQKLLWFFDKMESDENFRGYVIGTKIDALSQSLDFLLIRPLSEWLVLFDPWNWPNPKSFGITLISDENKCSANSKAEGKTLRYVFGFLHRAEDVTKVSVEGH